MTQAEHCHLHSNEPISFQTGNYHIKVRNKKKKKQTKQVNHRLMSDQQLSITQQEVNLVCLFLMKTLLA